MKTRLLTALLLFSCRCLAGPNPLDEVDPFTGTSNSRWMLFPGATLPFGLAKLSPDNQANVWNGGYEYTVGSISGFSHLHAFSLSGLSLMPVTGPIEYMPGMYRVYPGSPDGPFGIMWTSGYRSRIRKSEETASPGYYSVRLLDWDVKAEVTTTMRCGLMRLTYPKTDEAHIVVDFAFPPEELCKILSASVERTSPSEITGSVRQSNQYAGVFTVHFVVQTDRPFASMDSWQRGVFSGDTTNYGTDWRTPVDFRRGVRSFSGHDGCGVVLNFRTGAGEVVRVRSGLSLVSDEEARRNLRTETAPYGWDFDAAVRAARAAWSSRLGTVEVSGGTEAQRRTFYTCLYRAYSAKSVISDADGSFVDRNGRPGRVDPARAAMYSSDSVWGCQWTLFPLWTLLSPDLASSWVHCLLESARRGGWLPQAPVNGRYAPVMVAQHEQSLIVSSYQKGIRDFDAQEAFRDIKHDLTTQGVPMADGGFAGDRNLATYEKHGFVPDEEGPSSNTFEYAYDDWAASQFALALGRTEDYRYFLNRSQNYRNGFDARIGWARRRHADGSWVEPFDLFHFGTEGGWNGHGWVEEDAWVYSWFVPQDLAGLVRLMGPDRFNRRLVEGFEKGYVDLTNEPNLQAPFLFNYSGRPWLTQKYSRWCMDTLYNTDPLTGWVGEEDEGQLSAIYVMWAMGLFEMDGGCSVRPYYDLSGPLFDRVVLHLDKRYYGGRDFVIEAHGNSAKNCYIQSAKLNGRPLNRAWIYHDEIVAGGKLELEMGPEPNPAWGTGPGTGQPIGRPRP